jgi:hypothetical protein
VYPENVPYAAALLAEYGPEFEKSEEQAAAAVKEIRELVKALDQSNGGHYVCRSVQRRDVQTCSRRHATIRPAA